MIIIYSINKHVECLGSAAYTLKTNRAFNLLKDQMLVAAEKNDKDIVASGSFNTAEACE